MDKILDGKKLAAEIKAEIAQEVRLMKDNGLRAPGLAVIIVGNDPASETYVASKIKSCHEVGYLSKDIRLAETASEQEILNEIQQLNNDSTIDGFIIQLPLPNHISEEKIIATIDPAKDVDGFHPLNVGKLSLGLDTFVSATPAGIIEILDRYQIETCGKEVVVVGRSNIVGTPVSLLLSRKAKPGNATVTICHSRTNNLATVCRRADILIVAIGQPEFITAEMIKEGAVVIDVGIHRVPSNKTKSGFKLVGDVNLLDMATKASFYTPVPGGVGPMTIISLLKNTLKAAKIHQQNLN